jgi:Protein of unknown function (DUF3575)
MISKIKIPVIVLYCMLYLSSLNAQDTTAIKRRNVFKSNFLSPVSLGYERSLGRHFSAGINILYFPSMVYGQPKDIHGRVDLVDPSTGLSAEVRYYTSKTKSTLNGFYIGGFSLFRIVDVKIQKLLVMSVFESDVTVIVPSDLTMGGLMVGWQKIRAKGFTIDFNMGAGYYKVGNVPDIESNASPELKTVSDILKFRQGIGPRMSFSLGYAF